ncbi:MAG: hypothetical protein QM808_07405 [Steroidobacteraceae bacterium]
MKFGSVQISKLFKLTMASSMLYGVAFSPITHAASTDAVKHGEYLVTAFGCGDCHTPLKMGANGPEPDMSRKLSGHPANVKMTPVAVMPKGNWGWLGAATNTAFQGPWGVSYAPNLTPDVETGLGNWSETNFVGALKTGKHVGVSRPILPPMPWQSLSTLTESDLKAMFAYLRSLKPIKNRVPDPTPPATAVAAAK